MLIGVELWESQPNQLELVFDNVPPGQRISIHNLRFSRQDMERLGVTEPADIRLEFGLQFYYFLRMRLPDGSSVPDHAN